MAGVKLLSEIIKKRRLELGYSQETVAEKVGVSRQSVSLWETSAGESGDMPSLRACNLVALEKALQLQPGELLKTYYQDGENPQ